MDHADRPGLSASATRCQRGRSLRSLCISAGRWNGKNGKRIDIDVEIGSQEQGPIPTRPGDELPPLRFVDDGTEALRRPDRPGLVKNGGVLISLGAIEPRKGRVHVANTLWCGGKRSQWQTYVLSQRSGRWAVIGNSGPVVAS